MKKLLLILCLLAHAGFGQTSRIDSLKRNLTDLHKQSASNANDTLYSQALRSVMKAYDNINVDSASHYNTLLINFCTSKKLEKELIYAYQFSGYLSQIKGDHHQSIHFHYKALLLAEKLRMYQRAALSYGALAHAYTSLEQYGKAVKLCKQGLSVLTKHPDTEIQLSILNVLGSVYREQGQLDNALKINTRLYELARASSDSWYESYGLHAVGRVFNDKGDVQKALQFYHDALVLSQRTGSIELQGNILLNTADLYIKQKNWDQAYSYSIRAKNMAGPVKSNSLVMEAEEKLAIIFKNTGRPAEALKAYENFITLKEHMSREKNQQRIEALQAQYDNVQKTNALQSEKVQRLAGEIRNQRLSKTTNALFIVVLAALLVSALLFWSNRRLDVKNVEINSQRNMLENARKELADINKTLEQRVDQRTEELLNANRELTRKNEEIKEALFKGQTIERKRVALELHDNLSSLLSAVNMSIQSINPQSLPDAQQSIYHNLKHLIQNAYTEVRNISHNILPADLEKKGLAPTLTALVEKLNQNSALRFSLSVMNLNDRLPVEIEFNVYSIVWELINNAIKHAQAGIVTIELLRTDTGVNLTVCDDGVGLDSNNKKRGVGLQNIVTRLESLGGTFYTPAQEKGTQVEIKIPIETARFNGNLMSAHAKN